jgi:hypothetical protein
MWLSSCGGWAGGRVGVGFQKSVTWAEQQFHAARSYSLIKPPRTGRHLIRSWLRFATGVGWLWRAKFAGAVRPSTVVPDVLREHHMQVPLAEDQHAVGEFGSDRAYEPFGETVRPRAARRMPTSARTASNDDAN